MRLDQQDEDRGRPFPGGCPDTYTAESRGGNPGTP